ncbi:MAG TPA: hypothetical protein VHU84_09030, partial [Lacipirellulaceae bacterium]|nr:hypothetical protein [Lacipirellulaceae bacterium]
MTEASTSSDLGTGGSSKRALAAIVAAFLLINACGTWLSWDRGHDVLAVLSYTLLTFQPTAFGAWTALGAGSIFSRAAITIPCLMLVFVAPGYVPAGYSDVTQSEFFMFVVAGYVVYLATLIVALSFRWITGLRILSRQDERSSTSLAPKFDLKSLLILTTLCALALGLTMHMHFKVQSSAGFLGPNIFLRLILVGGIYGWVTVLTAFSVPLMILHGHPTFRAILLSLLLWGIVTFIEFIILDNNGDSTRVFSFILLTQA